MCVFPEPVVLVQDFGDVLALPVGRETFEEADHIVCHAESPRLR